MVVYKMEYIKTSWMFKVFFYSIASILFSLNITRTAEKIKEILPGLLFRNDPVNLKI